MTYVSLASKYRPQNFQDMVGQESVGLALANAIRLQREPHAVIFTGVRGIGKTTTARIYAKALNCERGPTSEPCDACASCEAIQKGTHEDVLEIDGASNTGVDDVRALQETLVYVPQRSRFKIYIIDEVHMLSVSAFNALLKTLEEPPEHVVFIFATTELHKVPETIQSRCQVFHLQKISSQQIKGRLTTVLGREAISFDEKALSWIAREGKGSLRDALTLLDQVIAVGGGEVSWAAVEPMVTTGHSEPVYELLKMLLEKNGEGVLQAIARWDQEGLAMPALVEELVKAARNAFVLKSVQTQELGLLDLEDRELEVLRTVGQSAAMFDLNRIFRTFVKCLDDLRSSEIDRFVVENYALEWCLDPGLPDLNGLIQGTATTRPAAPQVAAPRSTAPAAAPASAPTAEASTGGTPSASMGLRDRWKLSQGQNAGQSSGSAPASSPAPAPSPSPSPQAAAPKAASPMMSAARPSAQAALASPAPQARASEPAFAKPQAPAFQPTAVQAKAAVPAPTPAAVAPAVPAAAPAPRIQEAAPAAQLKPTPAPSAPEVRAPATTPSTASRAPSASLDRTARIEAAPSRGDDDLPPWMDSDAPPPWELGSSLEEPAAYEDHLSSRSVASMPPPQRKESPAPVARPSAPAPEAKPAPAAPQAAAPQVRPAAQATPAAPEAMDAPASWPASWKDFVEEWKKQKPLQARVLEETFSLEYSPKRIRLAVESETLAGKKLLHLETRKKLQQQFEQLFGFKGVFDVVPKEELTASEATQEEAPRETLLETRQKEKAKERDELRQVLEAHPLTKEAILAFDGTIEAIELQ